MRAPVVLGLILVLCGCQSEQPAPAAGSAAAASSAAAPTASAVSDRVQARRSDEYELRIVDADIDPAHRPLLREVTLYSAQMRDEFLGQVQAAKAEGFEFELPWQLELELAKVVDSEALVVVQANGYQFQGGAHGLPLQASFVYLPLSAEIMRIDDWFADDAVWATISRVSVGGLQSQLAPLMGEDDDDSAEGLDAQASQWLSDGAGPDPQNFQLYMPVLDDAGLIRAFEITYAPYQVAPYAAGSPQVEIAAEVLLPHVKEAYRGLFATE